MKHYQKLPIPSTSAWGKKSIWHWRIREFFTSIKNIVRWIPTIWKDRDWDDFYITKLLQKKIEFQRKYLVKHNRHTNIDRDNFWMTVVLNLIEKEHEEFYSLEKYDYEKSDWVFIPSKEFIDSFEIEINTAWENLDAYLSKYPASIRRVKKQYPEKDFSRKETLALYVGMHNQQRCRNLIFEILKRHLYEWWD